MGQLGPMTVSGEGFQAIDGPDGQLLAMHIKMLTAGPLVQFASLAEPKKVYHVGTIAWVAANLTDEFDGDTGVPYVVQWLFIDWSRQSWQLDCCRLYGNGVVWALTPGTEVELTVYW